MLAVFAIVFFTLDDEANDEEYEEHEQERFEQRELDKRVGENCNGEKQENADEGVCRRGKN